MGRVYSNYSELFSDDDLYDIIPKTKIKPPPMAAPKKKTTNIKAIQYYAADSAEVLAVKKAFKLPEKTEQIIDEYISKIKEELANIDIVKKQEKEDEINHKAEVLQHVMNQEKMDIG